MASSSKIRAFAAVEAGDKRVREWSYEPRALQPNDVEIRITASGVCHSDLHQILQEWGPNEAKRPIVPGHEIVGYVVRAGPQATHKVGDRVAVGTGVGSCGQCEECSKGDESYCPEWVDTYMGVHKATGTRTHGGYADRVVVDSKFVFAVPPALPSTTAAPLMCAGITVYQPLKRHFKENAAVGVVGIGGLGHLALQFARALGYKRIVALTTSKDKGEASKKFGAQEYIVLSAEDDIKKHARSLDVMLVTASGDLNWKDLASLMKVAGMMCMVGLPASREVRLPISSYIMKRLEFSGSLTGGTAMTPEMLQVAALHKVRVAVELYPLEAAGANAALDRVAANLARFRCVLVPSSEMEAVKKEVEQG